MYPEVNYKRLRNISDQIIPDNAVLHLLALSYIRDLLYFMFEYTHSKTLEIRILLTSPS